MRLHENKELFADAITAAARPQSEGGLGIKDIFIEKDYWISRCLQLLAKADTSGKAVFKGGTSLSKAYGIGARFSEDIDIAILDAESISGNQLKNLIKRISKGMTEGLEEKDIPGVTSKGSHYHKAFYTYPRAIATKQVGTIKAGQVLVEINAFANPYPFEKRTLQSFLTDFFIRIGQEQLIEEYDMQPFEITVLDKRRTLTEKMVSLIRCSLANDYIPQMSAKIRHFYDLHHLLKDEECKAYLNGEDFKKDFTSLFLHDQQNFDKPEGWQNRTVGQSPLITDLHETWSTLLATYENELPDLAYKSIPTSSEIENSIKEIMQHLPV